MTFCRSSSSGLLFWGSFAEGKLWGFGRPRFFLDLPAFAAGGMKKSAYMMLLAFIPVSSISSISPSCNSSSSLSPSGAFKSTLPKVGPPSSSSLSLSSSSSSWPAAALLAFAENGSSSQFMSSSSLSAASPWLSPDTNTVSALACTEQRREQRTLLQEVCLLVELVNFKKAVVQTVRIRTVCLGRLV